MNKIVDRIGRNVLGMLLAGCLAWVWTQPLSGAILLRWDFEGDQPFHDLALEGEPPQVVADPVQPKNKVMRSILKVDSERSGRSEVRWDNIKAGEERWIGGRILVEKPNPKGQSLFQLGPINYLKSSVQGTGYFQVIAGDGFKSWFVKGYLERVQLPDRKLPRVNVEAAPVRLGAWQTFVIHARMSTNQDGILEFWTGEGDATATSLKSVYRLEGPNCSVMPHIVPVKWGIYIGEGNRLTEDSVVHFDEVVLGDDRSHLDEITAAMKRP